MLRSLENLSTSERTLVIIATVILAGGLFFGLAWRPLQDHLVSLDHKVKRNQATVNWMQQSARELALLKTQLPAATAPGNSQSLLTRVDQTARRAGLGSTIKRVEPAGKSRVRIRMEAVAFDELISWLSQISIEAPISIENFAIDRRDQPGLVDAHLTLTDQTAP